MGFIDPAGTIHLAAGASHEHLTIAQTVTLRAAGGPTRIGNLSAPGGSGSPYERLKITEIMYNPADGGAEFLELQNTGSVALDVSGAQFVSGITFTFPANTVLAPGAYIVLVRNQDVTIFLQIYPGVSIGGMYGGALANEGETLSLADPSGNVFLSFAYDDALPWPTSADGSGYSLVIGNPLYFGDSASHWHASVDLNGAPGEADPAPLPSVGALTFSHPRGFYDNAISLTISNPTAGTQIRYTTNGSAVTASTGLVYNGAIPIEENTVIRAAAFRPGFLPSPQATHTYLIGASATAKSLPAISLVGDAGESFYEPNGVMAIVGGHYEPEDDWYSVWKPDVPADYNNPLEQDALERPISFEVINPADNSGVQAECGIRVQGSSWHRPRYFRAEDWTGCTSDNLNYAKFSFRVIFRGEYGPKNLEYPLITESILPKHDEIILRGGHNDTCDPFIHDELARRLFSDMGYVGSLGMFAHVYINGALKGFYNPAERIDEKFFQGHYPASGDWDVITHGSDVRDGDDVAWNALLNFALTEDLSNPATYNQMATMIDVDAFIDYLILQIFTNNSDWPDVNWIAARERSADAKWRFYVWDSEFAFRPDYVTKVAFNEYPQKRGDGLNGEESEIPWIYRALKANPAFAQRWEARTNLHMFGAGALTVSHVNARYTELRQELSAAIPGMSTFIPDTFLAVRHGIVLDAFEDEGLWAP